MKISRTLGAVRVSRWKTIISTEIRAKQYATQFLTTFNQNNKSLIVVMGRSQRPES